MRYDDSLRTVLASDATSGFGAQATWRQLVDLVGRGRIAADDAVIERLRALRPAVARAARAASGRALAFAQPPAALVALFAEDELAVAAPVLRTAILDEAEWLALLPALGPAGRSVLRHRRDLPGAVARGLASFGPADFVLGDATGPAPAPASAGAPEPAVAAPASPPVAPPLDAPLADTPFQQVAAVARGIPLVAEALRRAAAPEPAPEPESEPEQARPEAAGNGGFAIADLVTRLEAFQASRPDPVPAEPVEPARFHFATDAAGTIRRVDGPGRAALVGVSLAHTGPQGLAQVDGTAAGAFRGRAAFSDARLSVGGGSAVAGAWRLSASPAFDPATGRFTGFAGTARRPRPDEAPGGAGGEGGVDGLRQLVHELRTPANAIAGFAELIETQLLGPVPAAHRRRAAAIRERTAALLGAIDDLDTAARLEAGALDLRPGPVALGPLAARVLADLAPLAALRGAAVTVSGDQLAAADERAAERVVGRLLAAALAAAAPGERLALDLAGEDGAAVLRLDRPAALADDGAGGDAGLLVIDEAALADEPPPGAPLLGTGFALRLARRLAAELGGGLVSEGGASEGGRLVLRLPAAAAGAAQAAG